MRAYRILISADAYRDGGSLEARFACEGGGFETIWLQAGPESREMLEFVHRDLIVYADAERIGPGKKILKGSSDEAEILGALHSFLEHPKVDVPFAHRTPDDEFLSVVRSLSSLIPLRVSDVQTA